MTRLLYPTLCKRGQSAASGRRRGGERRRSRANAKGSKGGEKQRKLLKEGERGGRKVNAYLTWHTGRVSRHILIEFFSRSGNAGISRRYYYIFRRCSRGERDISLSFPPPFSPTPSVSFSLRLIHLEKRILSLPTPFLPPPLSLSAMERTYLVHYTCTTAVSS